jgi:hypothetical protein
MRMARVPVLAVAAAALLAPLACLAAPSSGAASHCAQALAIRLNVRVVALNEQPNMAPPLGSSMHSDQYLLTARMQHGSHTQQMVCTVDSSGQVVSLRRPAAADTLPLLDAASQ